MLLFNLAFFLAVTAIIISVVNPKSKTQICLYSIGVPFLLAFAIAVFEASFSESRYSYSNKIAESIGGSLISIIVAIITLFICLKKKFTLGEQYKMPKSLVISIAVFLILGAISEYGNYSREKKLRQSTETSSNEHIVENVNQTTKTFDCENAPHAVLKLVSDYCFWAASYREIENKDGIDIWDDEIINLYGQSPVDDNKIIDVMKETISTKGGTVRCLKILSNTYKIEQGMDIYLKVATYIMIRDGFLFTFAFTSPGKYVKGDKAASNDILMEGLMFKD
jgi:hypothetical protein